VLEVDDELAPPVDDAGLAVSMHLSVLVSLSKAAAFVVKSDPAHRQAAGASASGFELPSDEALSRELQQQTRPEGDSN
jgi:hypothetical protein